MMSDELPLLPPELAEVGKLDEVVELYEPEAPVAAEHPYPDWTESTTYVISGPIGDTKYPGVRHPNWLAAQRDARARAGRMGKKLYAFWTVPGRWFARLSRESV